MTATTLTPAEKTEVDRFGIHDDDVLAWLSEEGHDSLECEAPTGCERTAVARFVVDCPCRRVRLGCDPHLASTAQWFDNRGVVRCKTCGGLVVGYRIVPL